MTLHLEYRQLPLSTFQGLANILTSLFIVLVFVIVAALLVVVAAEGETPALEEINAFLADKVAKWWLPDDLLLLDELPHTATGKVSKLNLREQLKDYVFPGL